VKSYSNAATKDICSTNACCNITNSEGCSISGFPKDKTTLVLPGGETQCIFSDSTPFAFQVIPGDSDKLLFYFQGGGACWDETSTKLGFCTSDVSPQQPVGIFDRSNTNNAFRSYTIVHVLYCSGDVHAGNSTRPYTDRKGKPVVQAGVANTRATLNWVQEQMKAARLSSTLSDLVVMGCSAGSMGAQLWAQEILKTLPYKRAAVVPDSYAGVFAPGTMGPIIYDYGFCESGLLNAELYQKCINQQLEFLDMELAWIPQLPMVPYSFLQSKTDIVQISFYIALAFSSGYQPSVITPEAFYNGLNLIFGAYNSPNPNFLTYLVDGSQHCFTNKEFYYEATTKGKEDNGTTTTTQKMYEFVNQYPLEENESEETKCDGTLQGGKADNTYCSSKVAPKTFVEHW
jgi:hypothetical protein